MDFKVFLSDVALSDLERIVAYIAPHNPVAAEQLGNLQQTHRLLGHARHQKMAVAKLPFSTPCLRENLNRARFTL